MTKAEFLDDPLGHYYGRKGRAMMGSIPIEWVREAWETNAPFRTDATAALLKSIYKTGSLGFASEWVGQLATNLSAEQCVLLFEVLREGVDRSEREWRGEFEQAFTQCEGLLPPPNRERIRYYLAITIFWAMWHKQQDTLQKTISEFLAEGFTLNDARLTVIKITEVATFKCFETSGDDDSWSALQVAEAEGMHETARLLREFGASE